MVSGFYLTAYKHVEVYITCFGGECVFCYKTVHQSQHSRHTIYISHRMVAKEFSLNANKHLIQMDTRKWIVFIF